MPRNYKKEYESYGAKPKAKKDRASRKAARAVAEKKYGAAAIKGKDIDHKNGNPRDNRPSNLRVTSP